MNEPWRFTYTYSTSDLREHLGELRSGTFTRGYLLHREVLLQSHERGLIRLPEGFNAGEAHMIPVANITFIEPVQEQHRH